MGSYISIYDKLDNFEKLSTKLNQIGVINNNEHQANIENIVRMRTSSVSEKEKDNHFMVNRDLGNRYHIYCELNNKLISDKRYLNVYNSCLKHLNDIVKAHCIFKQLSGDCPFKKYTSWNLSNFIDSVIHFQLTKFQGFGSAGYILLHNYAQLMANRMNKEIQNYINADRDLQMIFIHNGMSIFNVSLTEEDYNLVILSSIDYDQQHACVHCEIDDKK